MKLGILYIFTFSVVLRLHREKAVVNCGRERLTSWNTRSVM